MILGLTLASLGSSLACSSSSESEETKSSGGNTAASGSGGAGGASALTGGASAVTGGAAGSGAAPTACGAACQRLATCGLSNATCASSCESLGAVCPSETSPYVACLANEQNPVTCVGREATIAGCSAQERALDSCLVCQPMTGEGLCDTCTRTACCTQVRSYVGAADIDAFDACRGACTTQACADQCAAASPLAGTAFESVQTCSDDKCAESCICGAETGDSDCLSCAKTNCCASLVQYVQASDIDAFDTCLNACTDQTCADACATGSPNAGAAFAAYAACAGVSCVTACNL